MNRLSRVLLAGLVMASSLIMPVGAWDKYSFVGDSVYFGTPVSDAQLDSVDAKADSSSSSSLVGLDLLQKLSYNGGASGVFNVELDLSPYPNKDGIDIYPAIDSSSTLDQILLGSSGAYHFQMSSTLPFPSNTSTLSYESFYGFYFSGVFGEYPKYNYTYADFPLDLSSLGDFSAFSMHGTVNVRGGLLENSSWLSFPNAVSCTVFVNGAEYRTFYTNSNSRIDFADSIFSSSNGIDSVMLRFTFPMQGADKVSNWRLRITFDDFDSLRFDTLSGESVLDGYVDNAQDSINDWDSIESEFGSDATEGFNGLDLDNFTYPSDFLAAFSLVSGIFTDLWNCMGDFQIIYLLPLTLGICLLLVGRVSRSSVPSPPPLHTDLPVSNSLGPPSRPALKGGKR